jgi:hypothetical protein
MNNELERMLKQSWPTLRHYAPICFMLLSETREMLVRIVGVPAEIRTVAIVEQKTKTLQI